MLLLTFLTLSSSPLAFLMSFTKKNLVQKLSDPHNDKVDFVIVEDLNFWRFLQ